MVEVSFVIPPEGFFRVVREQAAASNLNFRLSTQPPLGQGDLACFALRSAVSKLNSNEKWTPEKVDQDAT
jgi:hypothetical protein